MARGRIFLLLGLVAVALGLRVSALSIDGHAGDVRIMAGWAERMAHVGPWRFYDDSIAIYPTLLYPLWLLGATLDADALRLAVSALSIPFDLAIGALLFVLGNSGGRRDAAVVAALYLLNPAVLLAGPAWGQVDSAGTLPYLGALLASGAGRHGIAGGLAVVAGLVKPQFGLVLLPVIAVATLRARGERRLGPVARAGLGAVIGYVLVAVPLALHPWRFLGLLSHAANVQPQTSLHAFNPWGLLVGFDVPDEPYIGVASVLLLLGLGGSLLGLRRGTDPASILASGALLVLAFYFLPTRVHERYLFPAMAVLAPFAAASGARLIAYVALSAGFAASLVYALEQTTSFALPAPMAAAVTSPAAVWAIGLVMSGAALAWVWLIGVRRPSLPPAWAGPGP